MENHDDGHDQRQDMHEVVGCLEDERVGNFNRARIALCLNAGAAVDLLVADEGAQRYRRLCAYCGEVAEAHGGRATCAMKGVGRSIRCGEARRGEGYCTVAATVNAGQARMCVGSDRMCRECTAGRAGRAGSAGSARAGSVGRGSGVVESVFGDGCQGVSCDSHVSGDNHCASPVFASSRLSSPGAWATPAQKSVTH